MAEKLASHYKGWENTIIMTFLENTLSNSFVNSETKLEGSVWLTFIADTYYFIDCLFVESLLGFDFEFVVFHGNIWPN